jgi:hypothetical protein
MRGSETVYQRSTKLSYAAGGQGNGGQRRDSNPRPLELVPITVIGRPAPPVGAADEEIETGKQALSQLSYVVRSGDARGSNPVLELHKLTCCRYTSIAISRAFGGIRTPTAQLLRLATPSSWSTKAKGRVAAGSQPEGCRAPSSPKATGAEGAARGKRGMGIAARRVSSSVVAEGDRRRRRHPREARDGDRSPKGVELRRRRGRQAPKAPPAGSAGWGSQPEGCRAPSSPKATGAEGATRGKRGDGARTRSWSSTSSRAAVTPAPPCRRATGRTRTSAVGVRSPASRLWNGGAPRKVSHPLPASVGRSGPPRGPWHSRGWPDSHRRTSA